jgi:tetratricopeptide (TPR) repeat protein
VLSILIARLTNVGTVERKDRLRWAMEVAERLGDDAALAAAWADFALASADVAAEGLVAAVRAIELADRARQPVTLAWALNIAITELLRLRRFDEAVDLFDRYGIAGTSRFGVHEGHVLFQFGRLAMLQGDLDSAMQRFLAAEQAALRTRSISGQSTAWFGRAEVHRRSGRIAEAYVLYRRCLPVDLVAEPGETGLVRMMIVWTACLMGEIDVAEHHVRILSDECASERSDGDDVTMIEACSVGADGLLALAKGMHRVAGPALRRALALWASSDSWDMVADLIERLPEVDGALAEPDGIRQLARAVRDGSVTQEEALRRVGA